MTTQSRGGGAIDLCYATTLRRASRRISQRYDHALAPVGLRATQFAMLVTVQERQPIAINELADLLDLDRTTAGKNVRPLEQHGLVATRTSPADRRIRTIALTDAGADLIARALPLWRDAQRDTEVQIGAALATDLRERLRDLDIG